VNIIFRAFSYVTLRSVKYVLYAHKTYSLITLKTKTTRLTYQSTTNLCTGYIHM